MVHSETDESREKRACESRLDEQRVALGTLVETLAHDLPRKLKVLQLHVWWAMVVGVHLDRQERGGRREGVEGNGGRQTQYVCVCIHPTGEAKPLYVSGGRHLYAAPVRQVQLLLLKLQ